MEICSKIAGLQGNTLSDHLMTTGFGPFELPTCGLLKRGRTTPHLRLVFIFLFEEPGSRLLAFNSAYEYLIAKQNEGGAGWVELFIMLTRGDGRTNVRTILLAVSHRVLL